MTRRRNEYGLIVDLRGLDLVFCWRKGGRVDHVGPAGGIVPGAASTDTRVLAGDALCGAPQVGAWHGRRNDVVLLHSTFGVQRNAYQVCPKCAAKVFERRKAQLKAAVQPMIDQLQATFAAVQEVATKIAEDLDMILNDDDIADVVAQLVVEYATGEAAAAGSAADNA